MYKILMDWLCDNWSAQTRSGNSRRDTTYLRLESLEDRRMLAVLTVNSVLDASGNSDDGTLLLREAINYVNGDFAGSQDDDQIDTKGDTEPLGVNDTIVFDPTVFGTSGTIELEFGELDITEAVTIDAQGQSVTIDAGGGTDEMVGNGDGHRIFDIDLDSDIDFDARVVLRGLTLTGGDSSTTGGAIRFDDDASTGVASLRLESVFLIDNNANNGGGGIHATDGIVEIYASHFLSNKSEFGSGGGVYLSSTVREADIKDSEFRGNTAGISGGGLATDFNSQLSVRQIITIERTEFLDNHSFGTTSIVGTSTGGGGIYADLYGSSVQSSIPVLNILDSTISGNTSQDDGGGIWVCTKLESEFNLIDSTVSENQSGRDQFGSVAGGDGGGLWLGLAAFVQQVKLLTSTIENSTFSGNEALSQGGGIWTGRLGNAGESETLLRHATITDNKSPTGGGIYSQNITGVDTPIYNSIVSGNYVSATNSSANNIGGAINLNDSKFNFLGSGGGATLPSTANPNIHNDNPDLGVLTLENGGSTATHKPNNPSTNLVVDAWTEIALSNAGVVIPDFDQRQDGLDRVVDFKGGGLKIDIGALEVQTVSALPQIKDIELKSTSWANDLVVSLGQNASAGKQFHSVATEGAKSIEIEFNQDVSIAATALTLNFSEADPSGAVLNTTLTSAHFDFIDDTANSFTATWTLKPGVLANDVLPNGKYSIHLDSLAITANGNTLDATWDNDDNGSDLENTPDNVFDDSENVRNFLPGNGQIDPGEDEFRFHFAIFAGDYDGNHVGNGRDFLLWQTGMPGTDGDGDGDTNADADDLALWSDITDDHFPMMALGGGDFNDDEFVGGQDLVIYRENFGLGASIPGTARPEQGDIDGDGTVSGPDFIPLLQLRFGQRSAWYLPNEGEGTVAAFNDGIAPFITSVVFSGTNSVDSPYEFASIIGTGEQLRSVPVTAADTVSIQFSEEVFRTLSVNTLRITNLDGASPTTATDFSYDFDTQTATWTFGSTFSDGRHLFVFDATLLDLASEYLDGEVNNPWELGDTSAAINTSGDGEAGGDFRFRATILSNDTDRDNIDGTTDYTEWPSIEPGMILVSTTVDEVDTDFSQGDMSLREAIIQANLATEPTTIILPNGRYILDRIGTEAQDASYNDLDVSADITISGEGAGLSIIDTAGLTSMSNDLHNRAFHVDGAGSRLAIDGVTLTGGDSGAALAGTAVLAEDQATLEITNSAVVNNSGFGDGVAIRSIGADVTIRRSVFTNNVSTDNDAALFATKLGSIYGSVTIGQSIFALNQAGSGTVTPNVWVANGVVKLSEGYNLYDEASGNFFNQVAQSTDYLGTTGYVVTTVEDTFDHTNDIESLSLREAIDLANTDSGASEVWLPAWHFELTRDRGTNVYDTDISYGDLDITDSLTIRGVSGANGSATSVAWKSGIVDDIFDLLGDFDNDGQANQGVSGSDYLAWSTQNGSGSQDSSNWGLYSADADDDGDVDSDDYDIWNQYNGNTLDIVDILA